MTNPKQLLQIIHDRGEEAHVPGRVHDQARVATQELVKWIEENSPKMDEGLIVDKTIPNKQ